MLIVFFESFNHFLQSFTVSLVRCRNIITFIVFFCSRNHSSPALSFTTFSTIYLYQHCGSIASCTLNRVENYEDERWRKGVGGGGFQPRNSFFKFGITQGLCWVLFCSLYPRYLFFFKYHHSFDFLQTFKIKTPFQQSCWFHPV